MLTPLVVLSHKLPKSLKPFFWDVRFEQLDGRRDGDFVAARLLESGSWQNILWLCRVAGDDALQRLVRQRCGRGLSRGQLRFWQIRWGLPKRLVDQWLKRDAHRFDKTPRRASGRQAFYLAWVSWWAWGRRAACRRPIAASAARVWWLQASAARRARAASSEPAFAARRSR
ncbi:MAG: hypothetical protein IAG10_21770, partial [Planctomycetaceae bacterium]|nr:hypothetical protein [Planctomycetaceae bacterium]